MDGLRNSAKKPNAGSFPNLPHAAAFLRDLSLEHLVSTRTGKLDML